MYVYHMCRASVEPVPAEECCGTEIMFPDFRVTLWVSRERVKCIYMLYKCSIHKCAKTAGVTDRTGNAGVRSSNSIIPTVTAVGE